jgi:hypothetical protein
VTPSSGQGFTRTFQFAYSDLDGCADTEQAYARRRPFQFRFSDANGHGDITTTQVVFHNTLSPSSGCYLQVQPGLKKLWLRNDAGPAWLGPVVLGTGSRLSNRRCSVDVAMRFSSNFTGAGNMYLTATDKAGASSNWQRRGAWTVP